MVTSVVVAVVVGSGVVESVPLTETKVLLLYLRSIHVCDGLLFCSEAYNSYTLVSMTEEKYKKHTADSCYHLSS